MGTTKAFIKTPETVSVAAVSILDRLTSLMLDSSSPWNICEIDTGITWPVGYNVHGATTFGIRRNASPAYNGSGKTRRTVWRTISFEITVTKFWLAGKKGGGIVLSACGSSVATILRLEWTLRKAT